MRYAVFAFVSACFVFLAFYACQRLISSTELENFPFPGGASLEPAGPSPARVEPNPTMAATEIPRASPVPLTASQRYQARDREPYQHEGIYSGHLYGTFETSLFQDFQEDQFWIFLGPGAKRFWELWEEDKIVPPAYSRREETDTERDVAVDPGVFYPYLCVEATFRGRWLDKGCRGCVVGNDVIVIEEMLTMRAVPLSVFDCIPAVGALARGEWPTSARLRPTEVPTR